MAQSSKQRQQVWHPKATAARRSPCRLVLPCSLQRGRPRGCTANAHKGWCRGWCSRGEDRAGSDRVLARLTAPSSVETDEVVSARPDVQAHAKGRVETCQAHSSLQEIRLDKNRLSLLFFFNHSDTYTHLFVISCLELILSCMLCT